MTKKVFEEGRYFSLDKNPINKHAVVEKIVTNKKVFEGILYQDEMDYPIPSWELVERVPVSKDSNKTLHKLSTEFFKFEGKKVRLTIEVIE